jgi:hypothetical protein
MKTQWLVGYFGLMIFLVGLFVWRTREAWRQLKSQEAVKRLSEKPGSFRGDLESRRIRNGGVTWDVR